MPIRLVTVSGPRGAGKNTIQTALLEGIPGMRCIVPHTTRAPRPGEQDGREYHFVSQEEFACLVDRDEFVWHGRIGPVQRSGTVKAEFLLPASCSVIDVLPSGGRIMRDRIRELGGSTFHILVRAPYSVRRERAIARDQSKSAAEIERLMAEDPVSEAEMRHLDFDLQIDNSSADPAPACRQAIEAVANYLFVRA